ncbi:hemicentin-1-like isoform X2 [Oculina patagonica]
MLKINDSNICQGEVISITCSADGKPPVHTYQLFENDVLVNDVGSSGVWNRAMSAEGVFTYRCVANNTVGTSSKNDTVSVNVPSVVYSLANITVTEGDNRNLTCNVSGSPVPDVTWTAVNSGSRTMGITRELTNINRNDAGEYKCEASNSCGNDTASTFLTVHYKPENFQFVASKEKVCKGEVITFNCSADGNPAVDTYQLFENDTLVSDGINSHGMWNRTMSVEGVFIYKCVANNTAGTGQSETVNVTVNVPSFIPSIQNETVTERDNVTLSCQATGTPQPMVSWFKPDGQRVDASELMLTNISRNEAGEYRCEASNECGNASRTANIDVQYPPENVQLTTSEVNNKACQGDVISINCSADANPSVETYELLENDIVIFNTVSGSWSKTFTTGGVFIYKCVANNSVGTEQSASVTVTVNVASSILPIQNETITEGEAVNLTCSASGTPDPMVSWFKPDGQRVDGSEFMLTNINRSEAGEYRCKASNECGNASQTTTIDVQYPPENVQLTTSAIDNKACQGGVISINCSADANPSVETYELLENDIVIFNTSESWSKTFTTGGVFIYKCVVNNSVGTGQSESVTITVNVASSILPIQNETVTEGEAVNLTCNASGTPHPTVSWFKPDGQRVDASDLMLTNINRNEAGEYRCEASNECGNASQTTTIDVQYPPDNVQLTTSAVDNKACQGGVISINCSADANPSVETYELLENDIVIFNTSGSWSKTFTTGGVFIYKCVANNSVGTGQSASVTVTVNVASSIQPLQNETVTEGEAVNLTCNASGTPDPTVSWFKPDGQRVDGSHLMLTNINRSEAGEYRCEASNECGNASQTTTIDVQYPPDNVQLTTSAVDNKACQGGVISINCAADANPSVETYELLENDIVIFNTSGRWSKTFTTEGVFIYKCVANNSEGTGQSASVTVTVNVGSSIASIQNETVTEGDNVTLSCQASGTPHPMVSWFKPDGQRVDASQLMLTNISRNEAGEYRCEASNECGNASQTTTIDVQYPPENVQLTTSAVDNKACQGDVISINCSADANPSVETYELLENDTVILDTSGSWSKTFTNEGVFIYKCVANNSVGTGQSASVTVTVNVASSIASIQNETVTEGGAVNLTCNASGTPDPTVSWFKPDGQRVNVLSHLMLTNISRNEAGEYRCEASNECGNASQTTTIDVQYGPQITHISGNQTLNKEDTTSLNCTADGNPKPHITWIKVSDNSSVSFPLAITGKENEGIYRCTADNGIGSPVSKDVSIIVHYPSSVVSFKNITDAIKGKTVTLFCNVSGTPTPSVSWTHVSSGKKQFSRTWVITDIKVDDLGQYRCDASNMYGNDSKSIFVYFEGGKCEKKCKGKQSCRQVGKAFACLCQQGKTGENCAETEKVDKTFKVGIEFKREFKPVYEDLNNKETMDFVKEIVDGVLEEFKGSGIRSVKVLKLREGSVIADMELEFNKSLGQSEVAALLSEAASDDKIGELDVEQVKTGEFIRPKEESEECGSFFEGEDCKKAKPALIALCVVGAVAVLGIIVAIIAYIVHKKKSRQGSFSNGTYAHRVEPEGNVANGERAIGLNNHGNVNTGYDHERVNGQSYPSETQMVTFKSSNPAQTPGIAINDSSVTKKAQPGEGTYADLGDFHQKASTPTVQEPVKMPPSYEKTEYAEISQFLRAPVKTDEETKDESNEAGQSDSASDESSPHKDNAGYRHDVESEEFLVEI